MTNDEYTVGWICATLPEAVAARAMLDKEHGEPESRQSNDSNEYTLGEIGRHKVVIAVLPNGEYGVSAADGVARDMLRSFPNVKVGLMVGIAGGVPSKAHDIRLGDIVVSSPSNGKGGLIQYNFGKTIQGEELLQTGSLKPPPQAVQSAVSKLRAEHEMKGHQIHQNIENALKKFRKLRKRYSRPQQNSDRLFNAKYTHQDECCCLADPGEDGTNTIVRDDRTEDEDDPTIHYGLIASGHQLMRNSLVRDKLGKKHGVLCFETEAAGLMNQFPVLVIRGICDYSDSHENNEWQGYAAMTAAAYTKELLQQMSPTHVEGARRLRELYTSEKVDQQREEIPVEVQKQTKQNLEIFSWLTDLDYGLRHSEILRGRHPNTGQWILHSNKTKFWISTNKQILFCPGVPGAGKTVLTSVLVDHLLNLTSQDKSLGLAFVYLDYQQSLSQTTETILSCLLKQLCQSLDPLPKELDDLYTNHSSKRTRPSVEGLLRLLETVISKYSKVYIVIDAVDEFPVPERTRLLNEMIRLNKKTETNIFVTSRFDQDIEETLQGSTVLNICATEADIREYTQGRLEHLPKFISRDTKLREEVVEGISKTSRGMFLLARLRLDALTEKTTIRDVRKSMQKLGAGDEPYDNAYDDALIRIEAQDKKKANLAKRLLMWITSAAGPLTEIEAQHSLSVKLGASSFNEDYLEHIDMVSICSGLITIDEESRIIRLVHHTARSYFERAMKSILPNVHNEIADVCMTYLSYDAFANGFCRGISYSSRFHEYPFYRYASQKWGIHARKTFETSDVPKDAFLSFLSQPNLVAAAAQPLLVHGRCGPEYERQQVTPLHLVSYFGLADLAAEICTEDNVNARTSYGETPLLWAAEQGHEDIVRLLIGKGASIDAADIGGSSPLRCAAENGHTGVVQFFTQQNGGSLSGGDEATGKTPLLIAAENGHEDTVRLLVENGAPIDSADIIGQTALSLAADNGHESIVRFLVENHASIETTVHRYSWTPLSMAAMNGHGNIVRYLVENGANVETRDNAARTPLCLAARNGHKDTVEVLIRGGAKIEIRDKGQRTPMLLAAMYGHENIVESLARHGASLESRARTGRTPLCLAAKHNCEKVVDFLVKSGAMIEAQDYGGRTPLLLAAASGHQNIVQALLEYGAASEAPNKDGETPLYLAAKHGHESLVEYLVQNSANLETLDSEGQTPLLLAAGNGHKKIVEILVGYGASIEAQDVQGQTPLLIAARNDHVEIVEFLADHGAFLEVQDKEHGRTPMQWASEIGSHAVAEMLVKKGALAESRGNPGRRPISLVAR